MEFAYQPSLWKELFSVVALSAVTLTGLLSIALSIHLRSIVSTPAHLGRARESLFSLAVPFIGSILVLIPQQGPTALGIELLILSVVVFAVTVPLQWQTLHRLPARDRRAWSGRLVGLNGSTFSITIGGASLLAQRCGGLVWLLSNVLICLVWSTYNAWNLMMNVADGTEALNVNRTGHRARAE